MKVVLLLAQMANKLLKGLCINSSRGKGHLKKKPLIKKYKYKGGARIEIHSKSSSL